MITKKELDTFRSEGMSDDEILKAYQEFDGTHKADITDLTKSGMKSGEILNGLVDFAASAPKAQPKAETWGDTAKNFGKAAQYGAAGVASGVGKTLEAAGYVNAGPILQKAGKYVAPSDYTPASSQFDIFSPWTYGYAPRALVEGVPGLATDLVGGAVGSVAGPAGAVAGFSAAHAGRTYGDNLEDRLHRDGKKLADATGADQAITLGASLGEGALGAVGIKGLPVGRVASTTGAGAQALAQLPGQIAAAGARDAVAGAAGNVVQQTGRTLGTDQGLEFNAHEVANAAGLGGLTGAAVRGAIGGSRDVFQSTRMRGLMDDAESSTRVADALKRTELDLTDAGHAADAVNLVKKQVLRSTKDDAAKTFLKGADEETRTAVADGIERLKIGQTLSDSQLSDLKARLSGDDSASLLRGIVDFHTLNAVKGLGKRTANGIEGNSFQGSALNRATNPFSKYGVGAGAAAAGATQIPGAAAALAGVGPYALGLAGAAGGIQAIGRGTDRLLATRTPIDQFTQRFAGYKASEPLPTPTIAPEAPAAAGPTEKQTDKAWARARALQARDAAMAAKRDADVDRAYADRDAYLAPEAKARDEAKAWKARDREEAAQEQPRDYSTRDAADAISEAYGARDAASARVVDADAQARLQARAAVTLKAKQLQQIQAQAGAEDAAAAKTTATRATEYDKAEAQRASRSQPSPADRAKAAQIAAAWKAKDEADAAPAAKWDDAEAVTAIKQAEAARQAQSEAALQRNAIERAAANPVEIEGKTTAQPKGQKLTISERAKAKVLQPTSPKGDDNAKASSKKADEPQAEKEATSKGDKPAGDYFEHEGLIHPIPDDVKNRGGYIRSIKHNQGKINEAIERSYDDGQIEKQTFDAIKDRAEQLKTSRNKKQAQSVVNDILKEVHKNDRANVAKAFDADFLSIWKKDE